MLQKKGTRVATTQLTKTQQRAVAVAVAVTVDVGSEMKNYIKTKFIYTHAHTEADTYMRAYAQWEEK